MNWWIQKQLRSLLMTDLRDLIPSGHFESKTDTFALNSAIPNSGHISEEMRWGYLAGTLGKKLFFDNAIQMSARQKSASEVLMNLGMYTSVSAAKDSLKNLMEYANKQGAGSSNAEQVKNQLTNEGLPTLENNLSAALEQYVRHLSKVEATPFISLLSEDKQMELGFKPKNLKKSFFGRLLGGILVIITVFWAVIQIFGTVIGITVDWESFAKIVLEWSKKLL